MKALAKHTKSTFVTISNPILKDYEGDASKRWYIEYTKYNPTNGKVERCREWVSKKLDIEGRKNLAQKRIDQLNSTTKVVSGLSIEKINSTLINVIDKTALRKKTKSSYKTCIRRFCHYLKKYTTISHIKEINRNIARNFLESLTKEYHPNTIRGTRNHLSSVFEYTVIANYINENPFHGIKLRLQKEEGDFNTPYNDYEKQAIEEHLIVNNYRLYLFTRFIFYAFLRPNELRHITVGDIDFRLKTIKVKSEVSKTNSRDTIPIIKPLYDLIVKDKLLNYPSSFYLFGKNLMPSSEMLPANYATSKHKEVLETLKIYKERITTLYAWKHTGNIHAYLADMDIKMIQRINRHKSLVTTEIYLKKIGLFLDRNIFDFSY